ncbi:MAG: hybrid sensor histidine kinase/response regulator [Polaromonas sp.]|nr:hybrid sensor histidine kinase/response regulator [Polaromonas sp.]
MQSKTRAATTSEGACTVLFVDDEPQACKWFARLFANQFSIVTAGGVDEALAILAAQSGDIAVLITDYRMPRRDGLDLLREAQRAHRPVVRLLATAYADKDVALAAINEGRVLRILEKPFDEMPMRAALREALEVFRQRDLERTQRHDRAAAMRETLGFLAHELNTPLATVLGYIDELKSRTLPRGADALPDAADNSAKRRSDNFTMLEAAGRRTQYAQSLIATFVQSAREAFPGRASNALPASRLVDALMNEYPFEGDERGWVRVELRGDFDLPGQRDLLYLVLCTLTKNALFALRGTEQPCLQIVLERPLDTGAAAGSSVPWASIRFTDNGPGIAPEILARLTREPVTTRSEGGGSGMGLVFCRRVLQSMFGTIDIRSEPGQGASVTLSFKPEEPLESTAP